MLYFEQYCIVTHVFPSACGQILIQVSMIIVYFKTLLVIVIDQGKE